MLEYAQWCFLTALRCGQAQTCEGAGWSCRMRDRGQVQPARGAPRGLLRAAQAEGHGARQHPALLRGRLRQARLLQRPRQGPLLPAFCCCSSSDVSRAHSAYPLGPPDSEASLPNQMTPISVAPGCEAAQLREWVVGLEVKLTADVKLMALPAGRPAQWCGAHKGPGMVDVANRRCEHENCHKVSTTTTFLLTICHFRHV